MHVEVPRSDLLMMFTVKVFCKIIGQVFLAWIMPLDIKKILFNLVRDVEKSHFHRMGALFLDGIVSNACYGLVIAMHGRCGLFVSQFLQNEANDLAFFAVQK